MYQHYETRGRRGPGARLVRLLAVLAVLAAVVVAVVVVLRWGNVERPVSEVDGVKQVSTVKGENLAVYTGKGWESRYWDGMNMGASLPGHSPGELAPTYEDYMRWFPQMKEMNVDVVRVYTILNPEFYDALADFNADREDPLWVLHGVWSPEEELIGEDEQGHDAYKGHITKDFQAEIRDVVRVVHGDADIPERTGHASGRFRSDISEYMLGWMVGTEWFPYAVKKTNEANAGMEPYSGEYFQATPEARPFESWLAWMLDTMAEEEMEYGWQHPVSFTNWPTTDPLSHPNEANEQEDIVPLDPMHVEATPAWKAGYFSQYHVYPYYPDFMRYEPKYTGYTNERGEKDPYAGYLNELRAHHEGIPLFIGEFGLPTSRGMAHRGPLGRDQGYHTEQEQGEMVSGMREVMRDEGYDGSALFAWTDEWFKFTWNTLELELPGDRRDRWRNRLTNEEQFGVISSESGKSPEETIHVDGKTDDWERISGGPNGIGDAVGWLSDRLSGKASGVEVQEHDEFDMSVSHDAAYLYLLFDKKRGGWNFPQDELDVGFGTLGEGAETADAAPGLAFPDGGIQTLLKMKGGDESRMLVNSGYDQFTYQWAYNADDYIPIPDASKDPAAGDFLPWKLALSRPLFLPQTKEKIPFDAVEVGRMTEGVTDPSSPEFDNLADWQVNGDVLEVRIPWMLMGFTDPSSLRVLDYPFEADGLRSVEVPGLRIYPSLRPGGETAEEEVRRLDYFWDSWEDPAFYERKKKSFPILREAYAGREPVEETGSSEVAEK